MIVESWRRLGALAPAAGLFLFAAELGTFHRGVGAIQVLFTHGLLLTLLGFTLPHLPRRVLAWLALAWGAVAFATFCSPVPRAGVTALVLLPAFLVLPWWVERQWREPRDRMIGLRAVLVAVAAIAAWALVAWWRQGTPGASMPLGHHNLLAAWLVALLPLAALGPAVGWPWAGPAALLGGAALVASSSLTGAVALLAASALWMLARQTSVARRLRVAVGLALLAAILIPAVAGSGRLSQIAGGEDSSLAARLGYVEAAWRGALERPWTGWGAGATHWTLALHLRPEPGIHPPGEIVADAHHLPVQWLYELGFPGILILATAGLAIWRRVLGVGSGEREMALAANCGLVAFAVAALGGLDLSVTALPYAVALVFGARLAAVGYRQEVATPSPRIVALSWLLVFGLALWQLPRDRAHLAYDRAVSATEDEDMRTWLRRAVELDPEMPLYLWRWSRWVGDHELAGDAARQALGLSPLWLTAGEEAERAGDSAAASAALTAACDLDPLAALAPFRLATLHSAEDVGGAGAVARALIAEPSLLAATRWSAESLDEGMTLLLDVEGVDAGWRVAAAETLDAIRRQDDPSETVKLGLRADTVAGESMSLFAFRRRPWPTVVLRVELDRRALEIIDMPSAATLRLTAAEVFAPGCRLNSTDPSEPG